ncbi:hypothetical protein ACWEQL_23715 [Kitasatospora sp. NPDC004240]
MRSAPRHHTPGLGPFGAAVGTLSALVLAGTAALATGGSAASAAAQPRPVEWVRNGDFQAPLAGSWTCDGDVTQLGRTVEGRPGAYDHAGCSQKVQVVSGATYDFSAYVSGAYSFVGVSGTGTGTGEVSLWANGPDGSALHASVAVGDVREVTVRFHGWYGQAPYRISRISLSGPRYPNPCVTVTPTPGPTPTTTCLPPPAAPVNTTTAPAAAGSD